VNELEQDRHLRSVHGHSPHAGDDRIAREPCRSTRARLPQSLYGNDHRALSPQVSLTLLGTPQFRGFPVRIRRTLLFREPQSSVTEKED
jgi:hypothetical protein